MVTLQDPLGERREVAIPDDGRVEVWKPSDLALNLFLGTVGSIALGAALYDDSRSWTGSRAGDAAIMGGIAGC